MLRRERITQLKLPCVERMQADIANQCSVVQADGQLIPGTRRVWIRTLVLTKERFDFGKTLWLKRLVTADLRPGAVAKERFRIRKRQRAKAQPIGLNGNWIIHRNLDNKKDGEEQGVILG